MGVLRTAPPGRYAARVNAEGGTPASRALEGTGLAFRVVRTAIPSSAEESASLQGIDVGNLLRSIVVRRGDEDYLFILVPGGRQIDWPRLRRHLGVSRLSLPGAGEARAATGYERGAITHPWAPRSRGRWSPTPRCRVWARWRSAPASEG
ncbi:MAG: aminoacyl-tRNA deacylase [Actinomycetota bacterium]